MRSRSLRSACGLGLVVVLALSACSNDQEASGETTSASVTTSSLTSTSPSISATSTAEPPPTSEAPPPPPAPPPVNPLTGGDVSPNKVVAAKIDNTNFDGRQFGTASADVVYVEMVEAGLTRLLAVFHTDLPQDIGPVRSVRTTDPELLMTYGAPGLVFSGGAGRPLDDLANSFVVDASQRIIGSAYWRTSGSGTYNLHANVAKVAAEVNGISVPNSPGFTFGVDYPALGTQRNVSALTVAMMTPVRFQHTQSGAYNYIRKGSPAVDGNGPTVEIANIVVQRVTAERDGVVDSVGNPSYKSSTVGSGAFTLYRDGFAIDGTWSRPHPQAPTSWVDASGAPVLFHPGRTWVLLAPQTATITEG